MGWLAAFAYVAAFLAPVITNPDNLRLLAVGGSPTRCRNSVWNG